MGILSSIFGAKALKKANKKALKAQEAALAEAKTSYQPFQQFGLDSLAALKDGIGLGNSDAAIAAFQNSPLYKLQYDAALKAGQTGTANLGNAAGMRNSGRTLMALSDNARDITNRTFQDYLRPLGAGADVGLGVTGSLADLITKGGDAKANYYMNKGQIKAGQYAGFDSLLSDAFKFGTKLATGGMSGGITSLYG